MVNDESVVDESFVPAEATLKFYDFILKLLREENASNERTTRIREDVRAVEINFLQDNSVPIGRWFTLSLGFLTCLLSIVNH